MMNKESLKENTIPMYMRLSFRVFMLLLLFWILTYEVLTWWTASMDESVYSWIMNTFSSNFTEVFKAFTNIWGTYWIIILTLILTSIFAFKKGYRNDKIYQKLIKLDKNTTLKLIRDDLSKLATDLAVEIFSEDYHNFSKIIDVVIPDNELNVYDGDKWKI